MGCRLDLDLRGLDLDLRGRQLKVKDFLNVLFFQHDWLRSGGGCILSCGKA